MRNKRREFANKNKKRKILPQARSLPAEFARKDRFVEKK
jgi:hypothetical protein